MQVYCYIFNINKVNNKLVSGLFFKDKNTHKLSWCLKLHDDLDDEIKEAVPSEYFNLKSDVIKETYGLVTDFSVYKKMELATGIHIYFLHISSLPSEKALSSVNSILSQKVDTMCEKIVLLNMRDFQAVQEKFNQTGILVGNFEIKFGYLAQNMLNELHFNLNQKQEDMNIIRSLRNFAAIIASVCLFLSVYVIWLALDDEF